MIASPTIQIRVPSAKVQILKIRYGWSKWGGGRNVGVVQADLPEWSCQVCGERQVKGMPFFEIPFDDLQIEQIRICSHCQHIRLLNHLDYVSDLLQRVKE